MEIKLKQSEHYKYFTVLKILSSISEPKIKPFCDLKKRELELFSIMLYYYNEKYSIIPSPQKEQVLFSYNTRVEMADILGGVNRAVVYELMSKLRKYGLITKDSINERYLFKDIDKLTLNFI